MFQASTKCYQVRKDIQIFFWILVIVLGFSKFWMHRFSMNPDGISYLDIADTYHTHGFFAGLNEYWSPLYSWLIIILQNVIQIPPRVERQAVHFLNFLILVFSFWTFQYFVKRILIKYNQISPNFLLGFSSSLFVWVMFRLHPLDVVSPDILANCFLFLSSAFLIKFDQIKVATKTSIIFGLSLALAFLGKSFFFPLAFVYLVFCFFLSRQKQAALKASIAFLFFAAIFIIPVSLKVNRFTFGEAGRLNHYWFHGGFNYLIHWQGEEPQNGRPEHTTRRLRQNPDVYEFGGVFDATYPPWYNPAYWSAGAKSVYNPGKHWQHFKKNLYDLSKIVFQNETILVFFITALWILFSFRPSQTGHSMCSTGFNLKKFLIKNLTPLLAATGALAGIAGFSLVLIEARYISGMLLVVGVVLFYFLTSKVTNKRSFWSYMLSISFCVIFLVRPINDFRKDMTINLKEVFRAETNFKNYFSEDVQWRVAENLDILGVKPGDKVAVVGYGFNSPWARLDRVKIVSEVLNGAKFCEASKATQSDVFRLFQQAGARAVIGDSEYFECFDRLNWTSLHKEKRFFVKMLN